MSNAKVLIPLVLSLLLAACGPVEFLNSCFSDQALIFDPALVGTWSDPDGSSTVKFRQAGAKEYELLVTEGRADDSEPEATRYEAQLARLGGTLFLEMLPENPQVSPGSYPFAPTSSEDETGFRPRLIEVGDGLYASVVPGQQAEASGNSGSYEIHLTQARRVYRLELDGERLRLVDLSDDWLKAQLDSGRIELGHELTGETLVITASTQEVQRFLLEFAEEQGAFPEDDANELRRQN